VGEKNRAYDRFLRTGTNSDRLQFFSDAVFAIAMTLLVIDIAVPTISKSVSDARLDAELWRAIGDQWQQFLAYAISFWVIAVNWAGHHRKFAVTRKFDGNVVHLNLWLLFLIAFVPYPTSLISEYPGSMPAIVLYAVEVSLLSALQWWLWHYTFRKGYLDERVDLGMYRYVSRNFLTVPIVFLLSIPVGYAFGGLWAMYFWVLNWPLSAIIGNYESRSTREVSRSPDSTS
jgi:uncharacterized membrane protein